MIGNRRKDKNGKVKGTVGFCNWWEYGPMDVNCKVIRFNIIVKREAYNCT